MLKGRVSKLIALLTLVWFTVLLVVSFSNFNDPSVSDELVVQKEKLKVLQDQNKKLIEEAAKKHDEEQRKKRLADGEDKRRGDQGPDQDHPIEEREKAQEQVKDKGGVIQVEAPVDKNKNGPGI
jgi:hypothetical protein